VGGVLRTATFGTNRPSETQGERQKFAATKTKWKESDKRTGGKSLLPVLLEQRRFYQCNFRPNCMMRAGMPKTSCSAPPAPAPYPLVLVMRPKDEGSAGLLLGLLK